MTLALRRTFRKRVGCVNEKKGLRCGVATLRAREGWGGEKKRKKRKKGDVAAAELHGAAGAAAATPLLLQKISLSPFQRTRKHFSSGGAFDGFWQRILAIFQAVAPMNERRVAEG